MDIWPAVIQLYNHFLWKISSNSHGVNPRPLQLSLLLLNNTSNPILTSTRSHPFHFKARDWETIYSTKRRLNIDYWGSSKLEPVRTLPLWPPRTSTQFTLFSLSPIPKLLRAIPNSPQLVSLSYSSYIFPLCPCMAQPKLFAFFFKNHPGIPCGPCVLVG